MPSAIHAQPKQDPQQPKSTNPEVLIRINGELVEQLFNSQPWTEIVMPLLHELIAGVCGRFTNGRFYHGEFTRNDSKKDFLAGYQKSLMDLYNNLQDFITAKNSLITRKKEEEAEKKSPLYNPFMADQELED